jgi:hypothetical protein
VVDSCRSVTQQAEYDMVCSPCGKRCVPQMQTWALKGSWLQQVLACVVRRHAQAGSCQGPVQHKQTAGRTMTHVKRALLPFIICAPGHLLRVLHWYWQCLCFICRQPSAAPCLMMSTTAPKHMLLSTHWPLPPPLLPTPLTWALNLLASSVLRASSARRALRRAWYLQVAKVTYRREEGA